MTKAQFLKMTAEIFSLKGFSKKGNNFYFDFDNEFVGTFGLQHSNFGAYYYIEFGFSIKNLNPKMPTPKFNELNLNFGRVKFGFSDDSSAVLYESVEKDKYESIIRDKIVWFLELGRSGKNAIARAFSETGKYAIAPSTIEYMGIADNKKPVYPEKLWD